MALELHYPMIVNDLIFETANMDYINTSKERLLSSQITLSSERMEKRDKLSRKVIRLLFYSNVYFENDSKRTQEDRKITVLVFLRLIQCSVFIRDATEGCKDWMSFQAYSYSCNEF